MPNRILKEAICTSSEIDRLPPEAEIAFYRMIVNVDDFGRMEADPTVLRAKLFPRRIDQISNSDINYFLELLSYPDKAGDSLIYLYEVHGKKYLQVSKWENHQQVRAKRSKHPAPDDGTVFTINGPVKKAAPAEEAPEEKDPGRIEMKLAETLRDLILRNNPKAKTPKNLNTWATDFGRMLRLDKRAPQDILAMIEFSQKDSFWQSNILSARALRDKFDSLFLKAKTQRGGAQPRAWTNIQEWLNESEGSPSP